MNIGNYIEAQYRELLSNSAINAEYSELYTGIENARLREILSTLHYDFITLFRTMNERLPTHDNEAHFWADPSRKLIKTIEITLGLYNALKNDSLSATVFIASSPVRCPYVSFIHLSLSRSTMTTIMLSISSLENIAAKL